MRRREGPGWTVGKGTAYNTMPGGAIYSCCTCHDGQYEKTRGVLFMKGYVKIVASVLKRLNQLSDSLCPYKVACPASAACPALSR